MQEREAHREWIGGRVLTLLSHYWREDDPVELTSAIGRDWADVLQGMPRDVLQQACLQYLREQPRRKPTPGEIYRMAQALMPKPQVVREPEPERGEPCSKEAAAEILQRAGFAPKRMEAGE